MPKYLIHCYREVVMEQRGATFVEAANEEEARAKVTTAPDKYYLEFDWENRGNMGESNFRITFIEEYK